jgi:hypothetical protein
VLSVQSPTEHFESANKPDGHSQSIAIMPDAGNSPVTHRFEERDPGGVVTPEPQSNSMSSEVWQSLPKPALISGLEKSILALQTPSKPEPSDPHDNGLKVHD